ncbi:MAG: glycoside hydrolase family 38 C-terminal domain-containing protein [Armatimonadota bacterium]|nr:alpha-mannosidase [bacterium]
MKYIRNLAIIAVLLQMCVGAIASDKKQPAVDLSTGHTLYMVGYSHLDTQWRWNYVDVLREYIPSTMRKNFSLFEKYPDYIFNFSGANRYRMIKEYYPADYEKVKHYISSGQWFPCGSSMEECDVLIPSPESIIRQVLYGNYYFRKEFGKASNEFIVPDCFGFPASLPDILSYCGITGFSTQKLTWGSAVGIPFNVGMWEGLNGSSVIAALNPGHYGQSVKLDLSKDNYWFKRIDENGKSSGIFADYNYYGNEGDMGGAPSENSVKWIETTVKSGGQVKVISSRADQMFLDIGSKTDKLPRYKGDLLLVQHSAGSITSQAYMKHWNRENEILADSAERASVAANWLGGLAYQQKKLNDAWTLVMGGQFHDILPGTAQPKAYEFSWNDEILAMNQFSNVRDQAVESISSGLDTSAEGRAVVVYNPLSIDREDVVETTVKLSGSPGSVNVVGPDDKVTPSQVIGCDGDNLKVIFVAKAPSVGFAVYDIRPAKAPDSALTDLSITKTSLENSRYRVSLDNNGDIGSIYDKFAGREMLSSPIRLAFTTDSPREWSAWNIDWEDQSALPRDYVGGPAEVRVVENGPVRVALEVECETEESKFIQTISLSTGSTGNRVEISDSIDWRSKEANLKAVFPLTVSNPLATYNWEIGTIQRSNNDPKKYEVPSHQWFDLTDTKGDYGVTVLSPFKYGSDKPNDSTLRLTLLRTPGVTDCYYDQATQDWGHHDISYALVGHKNDWRDAMSDWQALRFEQPMVTFGAASHPGKLGKSVSFLSVSDPNIKVMAVKKAEDSDEIVVRAVETSGKSASGVKITFAGKIIAAREVNGQEQQIGSANVVNNKLVTDFKANELRSFAVKLDQPNHMLQRLICQSVAIPYNRRVTSRDGEKPSSGFDTDNRCIAAEMLPETITDGAVTFKLQHINDGKPNSVTCNGQTIALPEGDFTKIAILAAGSEGDQPAVFDVDGKKTSLTIQDWGGYIGQWDSRIWKGALNDYTPAPDIEKIVPSYIKQAPVAWFSSHRHNANGENELYSYSYLYTFYIDVSKGARNLALPDNARIHILALSMCKD